MSRGRVTIVTYTEFGPFYSGSTLVVDRQYGQMLINQYSRDVDIVRDNSNTWSVYPRRAQPTPSGTVGVIFFTQVYDPIARQTYDSGPLYRFTVQGLQTLNERVGGLVFYNDSNRRQQIPVSQLQYYVGQTIYVDQSIFAFRAEDKRLRA